MQARLEELQADQVRALLGPVATELATLHGELSELAGRDPALLTPQRVARDLDVLLHRVESGLDRLGMESVAAEPGVPFDRKLHAATRREPTDDPALDLMIARVLRQGFGIHGAPRAAVPARVTVYAFDRASTPEAVEHPSPSPDADAPLAASAPAGVRSDQEGAADTAPLVVLDAPRQYEQAHDPQLALAC